MCAVVSLPWKALGTMGPATSKEDRHAEVEEDADLGMPDLDLGPTMIVVCTCTSIHLLVSHCAACVDCQPIITANKTVTIVIIYLIGLIVFTVLY